MIPLWPSLKVKKGGVHRATMVRNFKKLGGRIMPTNKNLIKIPAVSEFMSQKLESITLHGIVKERWDNGGSP